MHDLANRLGSQPGALLTALGGTQAVLERWYKFQRVQAVNGDSMHLAVTELPQPPQGGDVLQLRRVVHEQIERHDEQRRRVCAHGA